MAIEHFIRNHSGVDFVVNTGADQVAAAKAGNPAISETASLLYFDYADNVNIEGIAISLPYQFGMGILNALGRPIVGLGWYDTAAHTGVVTEFGVNGYVYPFDVNVFIPLNIYVEKPAAATTKWGFNLNFFQLSVNMFNTPAALNTQTLDLTVNLKVRHTLDMVT